MEVVAPLGGRVAWLADVGSRVPAGRALATIELMKMEHAVEAEDDVRVTGHAAVVDDQVDPGTPLLRVEPVGRHDQPSETSRTQEAAGSSEVRRDLAELRARRRLTTDQARPEAVAKRRARGQRTARENVDDLVDAGSFVEYGALAIAPQRRRRDLDELRERTPADGLVTGIGTVSAEALGDVDARVAVAAYDATVLAGTQGLANHLKKDRLFRLAADHVLPVVVYAEGGGGRPGDTDTMGASWLHAEAFHLLARLRGEVPVLSIVAGRCFAGNAALAGSADVLVATRDASLGMAGPAMIAGGGLGDVAPDEIGPTAVHASAGTVDVVADDEAHATAVTRHLLVLAQAARTGRRLAFAALGVPTRDHSGDGAPARAAVTAAGRAPEADGADAMAGRPGDRERETEPDPDAEADAGFQSADATATTGRDRLLREAVPQERRRAYDVRPIVAALLDPHSAVELRRDAVTGMVTTLGTLAGRPVAVLANDLDHLGGAIDARGARDAADFLRLCDRWHLPVVVLVDTPGFMVGPEAEAQGTVRAAGDLFVAGAQLRQPLVAVVLRRAVGLGAQAMMGGHTRVPLATLCWPTAELAPMGLEGAVKLGFRRELAAVEDPGERAAREAAMVDLARAQAGAVNVAEHVEVDDVIDPADTPGLLAALLSTARKNG